MGPRFRRNGALDRGKAFKTTLTKAAVRSPARIDEGEA
jgi:hypothetical protein